MNPASPNWPVSPMNPASPMSPTGGYWNPANPNYYVYGPGAEQASSGAAGGPPGWLFVGVIALFLTISVGLIIWAWRS